MEGPVKIQGFSVTFTISACLAFKSVNKTMCLEQPAIKASMLMMPVTKKRGCCLAINRMLVKDR